MEIIVFVCYLCFHIPYIYICYESNQTGRSTNAYENMSRKSGLGIKAPLRFYVPSIMICRLEVYLMLDVF